MKTFANMPISRTPQKPSQAEEDDFDGFDNESVAGAAAAVAASDAVHTNEEDEDSELLPLIRQRQNTYRKLIRIQDTVLLESAPGDLAKLRVSKQKLLSIYEEFSGFHNQIIANTPNSEVKGQEREYIRFEQVYDWTLCTVEGRIIKCEAQQIKSAASSTPQVIIHQQPLKAPIPIFDGDYMKWPKFKAMFMDVMAQSRDSDAIKLYHLDKALVDKAAGVIDARTINEGNYAHAWNILTERYENQRVIVETHIHGLLTLPKMSGESSKELQDLLDKCINHVESLKYLKQEITGISELVIVYLLTSALDSSTRRHWEQSLTPRELPKYKPTVSFLKSQIEILERWEQSCPPPPPKPSATKPVQTPKVASQRSHAATTNQLTTTTEKCAFCGESHYNFQCNKLSFMSPAEKIETVRSAGVCFNCFRKGHFSKNCPSSKACRKCQKRHHTQLHEDDTKSVTNDGSSPKHETNVMVQSGNEESLKLSEVEETTVSTTCSCSQAQVPKTVLLLTAIVVAMDQHNQPLQCRVLLDSGSQVNFVTEKFANSLGIPKERTNVPIAGINNLRTTARDKVVVQLRSRCTDFQAELECLVTPKVTGKIPSASINVEGFDIPSGIQLADPTFFKADNIDMLLGAEVFFKLLKPGCITIEDDLPELRNSQLGWLVTGTVKANSTVQYTQVASIESIEESIQRFWHVEEVPDAVETTSEEQKCEDHFVKTHFRDDTGRYVVRLPLKENADQLDNCRALALKRFFMLEQRLQRQPELKAQYVEFINEYKTLEHCKRVDEANDDANVKTYYMPHHAVLRPGSSTTKCRVVFDASAKSSPSNHSLNDVLMVGPVVQSELFTVTIRSRKHRYVFKADVAKMYRQIRHHPDDMRYLRTFWRINPTDHLEILEMTTVTYGTASAPFQATRCLVQLAQDEGEKYPLAAKIIIKDTYVDDVLSGCDTLQEAKEAVIQLKELLNEGKFPIHKWCSNSPHVLEHIPPEEQELLTEDNTIKSLGLIWQPTTDILRIAGVSLANDNRRATKRTIYSDIAKLYDPLGLVAPVVVRAKLLVQQLWRCKSDWDDPVNDELNDQWRELQQSLPNLSEIEIPRQVTYNDAVYYDLQGFADASNVAYGACVYVRSIFPDGSAKSRLLCSKSKVAPLHTMTTPRMELCAALLLSRLVSKVIPIMEMDFIHVDLWSDSQITLAWLRKDPDRLEVFVRNRVAEILRLTNGFQWNYVGTKNNPADVVSRGQLPSMLAKNELWWKGPEFLTASHIDSAPVEEIPEENLPELKTNVVVTAAIIEEQLPVFNKFSCFRKLQQVIGWVLRFKGNACKRKENRVMLRHLTIQELRQATLAIIRVVQQMDFKEEIHRLESDAPCKRLGALNPFYDNGVLRVGGRLKHSRLPEESKHQIILPNSNPIVKLLIRSMHNECLHVGPAGLLSAIRQRYWLLNARSTIRQILRTCIRCFRTNPPGTSQLMGELPKQRVVPSPPFSVTGVDYAGPILVKQGRYRPKIIKSYIAVFVCMATKAIHLELVSDMTTDAFLAALKRFIARRGIVTEMHSDNGTNFRGAHHELHRLYELFEDQQTKDEINNFCQAKEMEWHFIPPDAPEFGGLWEAAVKSTKSHLKKVVGNATLNFEELSTLLCEIEAVLNSRPLFAQSIDPTDPEVITPAHFLIGRPLTAMPEPMLSDERVSRLDRWQHLHLMRQHFWIAWSRDYLSSLQPRKKNWNTVSNIKPGMIVLLQDKNRPPLQWKLGRVIAVYPGADNLVRAVDVFSEGTTYRRPITKLSVLPIEENQGLLDDKSSKPE